MRRLLLVLLLLLLALGATSLLGFGPVLLVPEDEQKIALFFGQPRAVVSDPGLSFAFHTADGIPLPLPVTEVRTFDRRWLHLGSEAREIQTLDRERVVVDHYAIWRIEDPLLFNESFPTGVPEARTQIEQQVRSEVRQVIGRYTLPQVLGEERIEIMRTILEQADAAVEPFGIEINDVRINRTELPSRTEENVYARMRAERERLARKYRAEGQEEARRIRAEAERKARVIVAEAASQAEKERGRGDAEATRIYAEAYSQDPQLYEFLRGLEAYEKTLGEGTTMVLQPDHEFFRLFQTGGADLEGLPARMPPESERPAAREEPARPEAPAPAAAAPPPTPEAPATPPAPETAAPPPAPETAAPESPEAGAEAPPAP